MRRAASLFRIHAAQYIAGTRIDRNRLCIEGRAGDRCVGENTTAFRTTVDMAGGFNKGRHVPHPGNVAAPIGVCAVERVRGHLKGIDRTEAL
jgi:hypothetical protein